MKFSKMILKIHILQVGITYMKTEEIKKLISILNENWPQPVMSSLPWLVVIFPAGQAEHVTWSTVFE